MRWDKKYPGWYPPSSPVAPVPVPSRPPRFVRSGTVAVAAVFVLSPFFACTPALAVTAGTSMNISTSGNSSSTSGSADPLGYRVRIPGLPPSCHWSAPLPSTLCQPPPAASLCYTRSSPHLSVSSSFASCLPSPPSRPPGVDFAKNMNIIRCLRIRRSAFPRIRVSNGKRGNERTNSRIKSRVSRDRRFLDPKFGSPDLAGGAHLR